MKQSKLSISVYAAYLIVNGIVLLLIPAMPLGLLGLTGGGEPWVRLFGLLATEIGFYYLFAARKEMVALYPATIYGRIFAAIVYVGLVATAVGPPQLLLFALVDIASALWTLWAIKNGNDG